MAKMRKQSATDSLRFVFLLNMLPIIGLMAFYYTRFIEGTYSVIIPLGLLMLWFVFSVFTRKTKGLLFNKVGVWWMSYLFLYVLMVMIGFSSTNLNFVISKLPIYFIPIIGFFVIRHYNNREKEVFLAAFFIVFLVNLLYNIYLGHQSPNIFEELSNSEESINMSVMMNIASTSFVGVCPWIIGAIAMTIMVIKNRIWTTTCLLVIIPIAYYILFQNTRGIAVLLLLTELVGFVLAFFEPKRKSGRKAYYVGMVVLLIIVFFMVFVPVMSWALEYIQSERLAQRFNDLLDFRKSSGNVSQVSDGSLSGRLLLIQTSFNTFISSPLSFLIGIGDHTLAHGGDLIKSGIGNHSEFVDVLARFGLIGAFVFWKIMKSYNWFLKTTSTIHDIRKYVNVIFVIIVLYGFLNLMFLPDLLIFLYIVFPIIVGLTNNKIAFR